MSELQRLQTTDWERRSLAETADATAHIYPDTARVIRELLSDYDVLRAETATLAAKNEALRAQVGRLREVLECIRVSIDVARSAFPTGSVARGAFDGAFMGESEQIEDALAATAPTGEEPAR